MKKLIILKNGVQTHGATSDQFDSLEAFEAWIEQTKNSGAWGKLAAPEYVDEMGNVVPAQEQEFEIQISDITAQVEAEKAKAEQKRKNKEARKVSLEAIDWKEVNTIAELKSIVQTLVDEIRGE